ncbi:HTH type 11 transcriptional regulator [Amycolatopsis mediterranei S699]|uniref:HTH type 11 transcriptional regulator n=2 Tax=Amycolatopsis mediterranei TaxID=33910 RepID=A0A0H3D3Y0_AMYMU|nr:WYL domain-containing protein [Amycolatopsis mediterranei]ADJ44872.1 HTH type 11 transcriptional regulator [Amycolatopsis mediterranei U32]AEK41622.1 HTH type 11 transcriptional regulator [Amycolatopsis mediterranei S699]AFO76583.1 HTH type 11 transcriptional regulator [Amycolatopsis mediterranei S699]AGT83712.1 HTH type 11 transcriptional regulator [Amycolatopsis mediterranei RB]KDO07302.1 transcriptional regulator [Amycolatopsis mediterranei]
MPVASSTATSGRLLSLLSLLQARRDWPGALLAGRLGVSERTVRRDVDRLRELGYPVQAVKGPDGGYRLEAGGQMPPLLFDEEQAVALAVALRIAVGTGAGIEEAAARALATVRQVMPSRLRQRVDVLEIAAAGGSAVQVDTDILLALSLAIRATEEVRFDYEAPAADPGPRPPRRVQPHHLVVRSGRWYLIGWDAVREDWRTYRVDRLRLRVPNGPRFTPREVPGGDVATFLAARFKGSATADVWPCRGEVVLDLPTAYVAPFAGDGVVEEVAFGKTRLLTGSWSWPALAAGLLRFECEIEVVGPPELRAAFAELAGRATRAANHGA